MYDVEIADSQNHVVLAAERIRDVVERTLADEQVAAARISVALIDNNAIHEINRQFLNHDDPTDVISFLLDSKYADGTADADSIGPQVTRRGRGKYIDGEVVISGEAAAQRAREFGWSSADETVLYLVHGLLHLAGYDDCSDNERRIMRSREREILAFWNLVPCYTESGGGPSSASRLKSSIQE